MMPAINTAPSNWGTLCLAAQMITVSEGLISGFTRLINPPKLYTSHCTTMTAKQA